VRPPAAAPSLHRNVRRSDEQLLTDRPAAAQDLRAARQAESAPGDPRFGGTRGGGACFRRRRRPAAPSRARGRFFIAAEAPNRRRHNKRRRGAYDGTTPGSRFYPKRRHKSDTFGRRTCRLFGLLLFAISAVLLGSAPASADERASLLCSRVSGGHRRSGAGATGREYPENDQGLFPTRPSQPGTITIDTNARLLISRCRTAWLAAMRRRRPRRLQWRRPTRIGRKESLAVMEPPAAMLRRRPDLPATAGGEPIRSARADVSLLRRGRHGLPAFTAPQPDHRPRRGRRAASECEQT